MKLVNAHKLILILLLSMGYSTIQAQEVWTLNQCIDSAQVNNKNLQINRNEIAISTEKQKEGKSNLIPKLSINADYTYFFDLPHQLMPVSIFNPQVPEGQFKEVQFGVPHNINANLKLAVPLYNPMVYGGIQAAKQVSTLTELNYQKTEEQIYFEISNLYYNAQVIRHQLDFITANILNAERLLKNIELLHQQSVATGTDVNRIKLQIQQLKIKKENANDKYVQVLNALKLNMGIDLSYNLSVEKEVDFPIATVYERKNSLDIQMIEVKNNVLNTELKTLQKTRYLPSLNLVASYGTSGFGYDRSPHEFLNFYPLGFAGLQFTYPLFNGMVTKRKVNQKRLEIANNELQASLISEKTTLEIENTTRIRAVARKTITLTENQIELAQNIYNQTVLQQTQGTANLTDILLADNALREVQQDYLAALIAYLKADLSLKNLTGNGSPSK